MKLLPVMDNEKHRILRVGLVCAPQSAIEERINDWLDKRKDVTVAHMDVHPRGDGTTNWAAVIQYYEDMMLCPKSS